MRSAFVIGLCMGFSLGVAVVISVGPLVASVVTATTATIFAFWVIEDLKRIRRHKREEEKLAAQLTFYKQTGRWPTLL